MVAWAACLAQLSAHSRLQVFSLCLLETYKRKDAQGKSGVSNYSHDLWNVWGWPERSPHKEDFTVLGMLRFKFYCGC